MTVLATPATKEEGLQESATRSHGVLKWVTRVAWGLLALQLVAMIAFSVIQRNRFDLTVDDASYYQAWYLIAHGHLGGYSSTLGIPFWKNNGEFITWPLALLSRPILSQTSFLIIADLAVVGSGAVGLLWVGDTVRRPDWPQRFPAWIAVAAFALLTCLNPWLYDSVANAWHFEPIEVLILMLAAFFLSKRRWKLAALFVALAMLGGTTSTTMLTGLGVGTFLVGPRWRRAGLAVFGAGFIALVLLFEMHPQGGSAGGIYSYVVEPGLTASGKVHVYYSSVGFGQLVKAAIEHPNRILHVVWLNRFNVYGNLAPAGFIGLLSPWGLGAPLALLLETPTTPGIQFSYPSFQELGIFEFVTLGTVLVLGRLALWGRRGPQLAMAVSGLVVANALLWAIVWLPGIPGEWIRVSRPAAAELTRATHLIPPNAEVLASTGTIGRFAERQWVYEIVPGFSYPIKMRPVYFVVTPNQGIESKAVSVELGVIAHIANDLHAKPLVTNDGVWVFRWDPPPGMKTFTLYADSDVTLPAWTSPGPAAGTWVGTGSSKDWFVGSNGREGYVVAGDYWRRTKGLYQVKVQLASSVPVNLEVWNQTANRLLARRSLLATDGRETVEFDVDVTTIPNKVMSGSGPFKITPVPAEGGNSIEIRVWTGGGGTVSVYSLGLRRI